MAKSKTTSPLGAYSGKPILSVGITVPGIGGGLRDALNVEPQVWNADEEITLVLRLKVAKFHHDPIKDTEGWQLVHVCDVLEGTVVDAAFAEDVLDEQRRKIEAAQGITQMFDKDGNPVTGDADPDAE